MFKNESKNQTNSITNLTYALNYFFQISLSLLKKFF